MKKLVSFLLLLTVLLTACATAKSPEPAAPKTTSSYVVALGWLYNDEFVSLAAAKQLGYYDQAGLSNIVFVSGGGATGLDPILAVNGMDPNVRVGIPPELSYVIQAYAKGVDVVAIGALQQSSPGGFMALTKNGLQAKGPCDFKGHTVAVQTDGQWFLDPMGAQCPADQGGPLKAGKDFTMVPAGWTPDCLFSGQCDFYGAWITNQPFTLEQKGLKKDVDYQFFMNTTYLPFYYSDVLVTTKAYIKEHPDKVKAFVQATMKGLDYVIKNPAEGANIASQIEGVDKAHAEWRIPVQNALSQSDDTKKYGLGYIDVAKVQAMIDFYVANGQLEKSVDAKEIIDNSFLPGPGE